MEREAKDVEPGDVFILDAIRVESAFTEGGSTFLSWRGDRRPVDVVDAGDLAPDIFPAKCPKCRHDIVPITWNPMEWSHER